LHPYPEIIRLLDCKRIALYQQETDKSEILRGGGRGFEVGAQAKQAKYKKSKQKKGLY
jgi:hypothetical protein